MDVETIENDPIQYWMNRYSILQKKSLSHQREIMMVWGHYDQMKNLVNTTQKENEILYSKIEYLTRRIEALEKEEKIRKPIFHESQEEILKHKKQRIEPVINKKRRATEDIQIDSLLLENYKKDGIMVSTRELRESIDMSCPDTWQRCHIVGLNLMKKILNYYTRIVHLTLSDDEFDTLKNDINNQDINIRCCSINDNQEDKVIEKEVLSYIFDGYPLQTDKARQMFHELIQFLSIVKSHTIEHSKINIIFKDLREERFPLSRYCYYCHGKTLNYEKNNKTISFCDKYCRVNYNDDLF